MRVRRRQPRWARDGGNGFVVSVDYMTNDPEPILTAFTALISALARIDAIVGEAHTTVHDALLQVKDDASSQSEGRMGLEERPPWK